MQLRILLSYWYYKDADLDALFAKYFTEPYPDVFADSGAFSAMTQGEEVNIDEYAAWVKRWKHLFSTYANLDIIKDAEGTLRNQRYLEDKHNLQPLPCFHVLEDWKYLEEYIKNYQYIALGVAGNQAKRNKIMAWILKCFSIAGNNAVFHGFGLTSWSVMSTFRWYSVDSSTWGSGFRFGTIPLFDNIRGQFEKVRLGDISGCLKFSRLFEDLGFDWQDFADRKRNDRKKICAISALSYINAEKYLRHKFGEVYIPGNEKKDGVNIHLVVAADGQGNGIGSNMGMINLSESWLKLHLSDTTINHNGGDIGSAVKQLKGKEKI